MPSPAGAREHTDWPGVAYGVALGVLAAFQQFKLPPALPLLLDLYGYPRLLAGGFMSVYALTGLLFSVAIGRRLARGGPKALLAWAFGLLMGGNVLALLVPASGLVMLASRLLEGLAFAVLAIVGGVVTTGSAAGRHQSIAVGLWATWIPLGQVAGSLLAIPVTGAGLWRPLWWAGVGATVLVAGWGGRLKIGRRPALKRSPGDAPGDAAARPCRSPPEQTLLLFVAAALFSLWAMQYLAFMSWLPQYLVEARGLLPGDAALVYLGPPLLIVVFNVAAGALLRAGMGLGVLLPGSIVVQTAVWFLVPVLGTGISGVAALLAYGASCGITPTCLFALPGAILGPGVGASRGFAVIMTGRNLGAMLGPVLLAQAVALAGAWGVVAPLFGTLCLVAAMAGRYLTRRLSVPIQGAGSSSGRLGGCPDGP